MKKIFLIGSGGHFNSCQDVIKSIKKFKIIGFVDKKKNSSKIGLKYLGNDSKINLLKKKTIYTHIAGGQINNLEIRKNIFEKFKKFEFKFPKIISPNAYVSKKAIIGDGSIVMHGAHVGPNARIGLNCIINTKTIIEHDVEVGDHCHISTGSIVNGHSTIGNQSFIGSGAIVRQNISIGSKCFVNANLFINVNLKDNTFKKK